MCNENSIEGLCRWYLYLFLVVFAHSLSTMSQFYLLYTAVSFKDAMAPNRWLSINVIGLIFALCSLYVISHMSGRILLLGVLLLLLAMCKFSHRDRCRRHSRGRVVNKFCSQNSEQCSLLEMLCMLPPLSLSLSLSLTCLSVCVCVCASSWHIWRRTHIYWACLRATCQL